MTSSSTVDQYFVDANSNCQVSSYKVIGPDGNEVAQTLMKVESNNLQVFPEQFQSIDLSSSNTYKLRAVTSDGVEVDKEFNVICTYANALTLSNSDVYEVQ